MSKFKVGDVVYRTETESYGAHNWRRRMQDECVPFNTPVTVSSAYGEHINLTLAGRRIGTNWLESRYELYLPNKSLEDWM